MNPVVSFFAICFWIVALGLSVNYTQQVLIGGAVAYVGWMIFDAVRNRRRLAAMARTVYRVDPRVRVVPSVGSGVTSTDERLFLALVETIECYDGFRPMWWRMIREHPAELEAAIAHTQRRLKSGSTIVNKGGYLFVLVSRYVKEGIPNAEGDANV